MNMRKNEKFTSKQPFSLAPLAAKILGLGLLPIYASLLRLFFEVRAAGELTEAAARYWGGMLEYPVAALAVLTALTFLVDRVIKHDAS